MKKSETKLLNQFRALSEEAQLSVIHFCDFLSSQHPVIEQDMASPKDIARPDGESVVLAMRRLSETYFMLDKDKIFNDASSLMTQHILQGREAIAVIDELETVFKKYYNELVAINMDKDDSND